MANFDFGAMKEKALQTAGMVADKSVEFAKIAGDKAKLAGRITKLKAEIAMEKESAKRNFVELGKKYYEAHKENPTPELAQAVTEISVALEAMGAKRKEVEMLKKQLADDFGEIMEEAEEAILDAAEVLEDAVEEITAD